MRKPPDEPAPAPRETVIRLLSGGHTLLLVTAVMLPVSGAIIRWMRYVVADIASASRAAVSAPIGELAITGAAPVLVVLLSMIAGLYATYITRRAYRPWWVAAVALLGTLAIGLVIAGLYIVPFIVALMVGIHFFFSIRVGRSPLTGWGLSVILLMYVLGAIWYGVAPTVGEPAEYAFEGVLAADGQYIRLGATDSTILLTPCAEPRAVIEVPADAVTVARFPPPAGAFLFRFLSEGFPASFYDRCPIVPPPAPAP